MTTKFNMLRDINGFNGFGLLPCDDKFSMVLAANTAQNFTVPSNFENWAVIFSYQPGDSVWVSFTGTATIPTGAVSSTNSELNPVCRRLLAGTVVSLITNDATNDQVGVTLYAL